MSPALVTASLLALAALVGVWRTARAARRNAAWLIAGQCLVAVLLYVVLFPPSRAGRRELLVVLTPGYTTAQEIPADDSTRVVALPGVAADGTVEQVPDLGSALRRHAGITRLRVVGGGLPLRDRDAAHGVAIDFVPAELPAGVVELLLPPRITAGSIWHLHGRAAHAVGGKVELRDRAANTVAAIVLADDGRFTLEVRARTAGLANYTLRVVAADQRVIEELPVAIEVSAGDRLRVLLVAGAPDAELKYLRRWAVDAGIDLRTRMAISRGISIGEADVRLDAEALREADLVIADERAWAGLSKSTKDELLAAVDAGLGLLLRVTGPVPAIVASEWAAIGFRIERAELAQGVALSAANADNGTALEVGRRPITVSARDGVSLTAAADTSTLASWRLRGRGRVALWWLADSYRLVLAGDVQRFGALWSDAAHRLARARAPKPPQLPHYARVDERAVLCGITVDASVETGGHAPTLLAIDPATPGCAAYWPSTAGWHALVDDTTRRSFFVLATDQANALARAEALHATRELALSSASTPAPIGQVPMSRWPFFIAWLLVTTLLWWFERRAARAAGGSS